MHIQTSPQIAQDIEGLKRDERLMLAIEDADAQLPQYANDPDVLYLKLVHKYNLDGRVKNDLLLHMRQNIPDVPSARPQSELYCLGESPRTSRELPDVLAVAELISNDPAHEQMKPRTKLELLVAHYNVKDQMVLDTLKTTLGYSLTH